MSPARNPVRQRPARPLTPLDSRLRLSVLRGDGLYSSPLHPGAAVQGYKLRPKRRSLRTKAAIAAFLTLCFVAFYYFDRISAFLTA